jgi:quercetin dioxygenase-like cupin family protein
MRKTVILGLSAMLAASAAPAQVDTGAVKWMPGPPGLPAGAEFAVLAGDPGKPGVFTIRARMPAGFVVPPHWHPSDEHLTLLSGDMSIGMGTTLDRSKARPMAPGGFAVAAARMNHFVFTNGGATIQVTAQGPFGITYVNPADDPRKPRE